MQRMEFDDIDRRLLALLQRDSSRTLAELGEVVGLSASAVKRRIDRYHAAGVIDRTVAVLDPRADVLIAICTVTLDRESPAAHQEFRAHALADPHVQQLYNVSGDADYVVVLATRSMEHHREVADQVLKNAPNLRRYSTMFALDPIRTTLVLPV